MTSNTSLLCVVIVSDTFKNTQIFNIKFSVAKNVQQMFAGTVKAIS